MRISLGLQFTTWQVTVLDWHCHIFLPSTIVTMQTMHEWQIFSLADFPLAVPWRIWCKHFYLIKSTARFVKRTQFSSFFRFPECNYCSFGWALTKARWGTTRLRNWRARIKRVPQQNRLLTRSHGKRNTSTSLNWAESNCGQSLLPDFHDFLGQAIRSWMTPASWLLHPWRTSQMFTQCHWLCWWSKCKGNDPPRALHRFGRLKDTRALRIHHYI